MAEEMPRCGEFVKRPRGRSKGSMGEANHRVGMFRAGFHDARTMGWREESVVRARRESVFACHAAAKLAQSLAKIEPWFRGEDSVAELTMPPHSSRPEGSLTQGAGFGDLEDLEPGEFVRIVIEFVGRSVAGLGFAGRVTGVGSGTRFHLEGSPAMPPCPIGVKTTSSGSPAVWVLRKERCN